MYEGKERVERHQHQWIPWRDLIVAKWWQSGGFSLDPSAVGEASQWVNIHSGSVGTPRYFPWQGGAFSPLVGSLRNESGGSSGIFDGLWHPLRLESCLSCQCSWVSLCPIRRAEHPQDLSLGEQGEFYSWGRTSGPIKSTILPCRIWLKAWLVALGGCSPPLSYASREGPPHAQKLNSPAPQGVQAWP